MSEASERSANRLIDETSPYLLQHAHNPVDWFPWGPEALERARAEDKPILLSVGYSACHWCHVMERESFEDAEVAALMNEHFVNVKVDREERPDVDEIYMQATLSLNQGHGGWPMNVFLTPDLEPFFAGTYFPPVGRRNMPGWTDVVAGLAQAWVDKREDVVKTAHALADLLREGVARDERGAITREQVEAAASELSAEYDERHGGFGPAPKFPRAEALLFLLRHHQATGNARSLELVEGTLRGMAKGGIYDHLAGGFARYSTDARWLVPHFEKMLYDNASLVPAYLAAFQVTRDPLFRRVGQETLDYLLEDMTSEEGAIYSATDADSEGVEGKFFVWTPEQVREVLDEEEARAFEEHYDVREGGNWEGASVLNTPRSIEESAATLNMEPHALRRCLLRGKRKLRAARDQRVPPALDDKVLTAWNGLALSALASGFRVLAEDRYYAAAEKLAGFLLERMVRPDAGLFRAYRAGKAHIDAVLEDYAYLGAGLLDLYEAGGNQRYLASAALLVERILQDFSAEEGGAFFHTSREGESLIVRYREGHDGATPNPNAVAALTIARLAVHLNQPALADVARAALEHYGAKIAKMPRAFCSTLSAWDFLDRGPLEIALVGDPNADDAKALRYALAAHFLPNAVIAQGGPGSADDLPLLANKGLVGESAALYLCENYACQAPITRPDQVAGLFAPTP